MSATPTHIRTSAYASAVCALAQARAAFLSRHAQPAQKFARGEIADARSSKRTRLVDNLRTRLNVRRHSSLGTMDARITMPREIFIDVG